MSPGIGTGPTNLDALIAAQDVSNAKARQELLRRFVTCPNGSHPAMARPLTCPDCEKQWKQAIGSSKDPGA